MGKYDLNQEPETNDVSKINAAALINLRVQDAWSACTRFYNSGEFDALRDELASLWPEFYADASPDQVKEIEEINKAIAFNMIKRLHSRRDKKLWLQYANGYKKAIYKKWLFLKTLEKSQGVGKAYRDPGEDDWE